MAQAARYAVFGHPVAHSKSPFIHTRFARQCQQDLSYTAIEVEPEQFEAAVNGFFAAGGAGLNITVPFKERAWQMAGKLSARARLAGAVNTLYQEAGQLSGDNTDGVGLVRDLLNNQGGQLHGARILILGAGGAVRGVLPALLEQQPASITIANRTLSRARQLVDRFAALGSLHSCGFEQLQGPAYDLIINATSAGLSGQMPAIPTVVAAPHTWCYDMVYADHETPFQRWGRQQHAARNLSGVGMLVEQAAEAFYLWRGVRPDTGELIRELGGCGRPDVQS
ncbi:MAG: shikimate dehydrogenase [Pseudomonadales bacterium]|nr:shikimate dehydrogenase [Pseudomonadales bacterium]